MILISFHHTENSASCCKIEIFCPSILQEELAIMVQFLYSGRIYCQDQNLIPKICKNLTHYFGFPPVMKFIKIQNYQKQNSSQLQPIRNRQKELISDSFEKLSSKSYKNENQHSYEELVRNRSRLRQFLIKFQVPETKPSQGWSVCFKGSKNVLHEILANRAWKSGAGLS